MSTPTKPKDYNGNRQECTVSVETILSAFQTTPSPVQTSLQFLRSLNTIREITIELDPNERVDLLLNSNMIIKTIRCAYLLPYLIVGDQIILINGRCPNTIDEAQRLLNQKTLKRILLISRVTYKQPIPIERAEKIHLKRQLGHAYFLVTVPRLHGVRMGLGINTINGKLIVNRTDENTVTAHLYMLGDAILDINGEKLKESDQLRSRIQLHMKRDRFFTTIVERKEPTTSSHNIRPLVDMIAKADAGTQMANEVCFIAQREIIRFRAGSKKRLKLRSILINRELELAKTQAEEGPPGGNRRPTLDHNWLGEKRKSTGRSKLQNPRTEGFDTANSPLKPQKRKSISINLNKNEEEKISTDVENPSILYHMLVTCGAVLNPRMSNMSKDNVYEETISTKQLIDEHNDCSVDIIIQQSRKSEQTAILIDEDNASYTLTSNQEHLLYEQHRYARHILSTFYTMAVCLLVYIVAHIMTIFCFRYVF
ncbi:PDZ/DHR/GLGF domain protein [Aphelenchoides besseyi]|nr:PDZ/DHR/GLGF domain protein [Aphelenchoides besseyi]